MTSGSTTLDESKPLLEQIHDESIMYVLQGVGAGQAMMYFLQALESAAAGGTPQSLRASDMIAIDAISSLEFSGESNQSLDLGPWPRHLQTLTVHDWSQSLQGVSFPDSLQELLLPLPVLSILLYYCYDYYYFITSIRMNILIPLSGADFWLCLQPDLGRCQVATLLADINFWVRVQPKLATCIVATQPADIGIWRILQPKPGRCHTAKPPADVDLGV